MKEVPELIAEIQAEVQESAELDAMRAAELDNRLSSLYGNVLEEKRKAEAAFNAVVREHLRDGFAMNKATALAKVTPAYDEVQQWTVLEKSALHLSRSLRSFGRLKAEEMRMTR